MFKVLDTYSLKARYFPAVLAVAPALLALGVLISSSRFGLTNIIASSVIPVLVYASADIARRLGKRIEGPLHKSMGGKPSITMLRYSDGTFSAAAKKEYRALLAKKIRQAVPKEQAEKNDVRAGDDFYERAGAWLRENTRSQSKFPVLFSENVTYGFRRNLLGLKWPAIFLNLLIIITSLIILSKFDALNTDDERVVRILIVLAFATVHSLIIFFAVTRQSVVDASRTYARQLILACESFVGK